MNSVYETSQTSGNAWESLGGERLYHEQRPSPSATRPSHLSDLASLESVATIDSLIRRFEGKRISDPANLESLANLDSQMRHFEGEHIALTDEVRRLYVMEDDRCVTDYLRSHRRILQLLVDAEPHLKRIFGNVVLTLRPTSDEDGWEMLYATVQWGGEPKDVLQLLDRFDDEWWIHHSYPAGTALTFTYKLT